MKSERRHELERNELADRLGSGIQTVQPMLPIVLGAIAILIVGSIGWGLYSSNAQKQEGNAWTEYYFNLTGADADTFLDVADAFPKSAAAGWARQTAGDSYLERGIEAIYRNRSEGEDLIEQAIAAFEEVENSPNDELRSKALFGLANAHETLGHVEEATKYYQQFIGTDSPPKLLSTANERLAFLNSEEGKEFYAWFGTLDPKPDAPISLPSDFQFPPTGPGDMQFAPTDSSSSTVAPAAPMAEIDPSQLPALPSGEITIPESDGSELDLELPQQSPAAGEPAEDQPAKQDDGGSNES